MKTGPAFEAFLARLYTDPNLQRLFQEGTQEQVCEAARSAGLTREEAQAVASVDRLRLRLTCESLEKKRTGRGGAGH